MALWSNNDAVPGLATARYTVAANAAADGTCTVTGTGSSFGLDGCAGIGTIIRFGADARGRTINVGAGHTYFGDAVIVVYGISTAISGSYHVPHQGWVGVTTYVDMHGTLRVKSEVLVAMSGITTTKDAINSTPSIPYPTTDRNS